jgi:hypothetical protein
MMCHLIDEAPLEWEHLRADTALYGPRVSCKYSAFGTVKALATACAHHQAWVVASHDSRGMMSF